MLKIIYFSLIAILASVLIFWLYNNNGTIEIKWLEYQLNTDILSAIFMIFFVISVLFIIFKIIKILIALILPNKNKIPQ